MKKTILTIVFCLQPLVCFGFNWEINDFGAIDKYSPGPGESKLILNTSHALYPGATKIIVKIDVEELKIEGDKRLSVILPTGAHSIQFSDKSFFSDSFKSIAAARVSLIENTISIFNIQQSGEPSALFSQSPIKVLSYSRLREDGSIFNRDPLSDMSEVLREDWSGADKYLENSIGEINFLVEAAKQQPKIQGLDDWYTISFKNLGVASDMTRTRDGLCHLYIFTSLITDKFFPTFEKMASTIEKHNCLNVLVDLTGPGGDTITAIKIGLYIKLAGWSTTWGGYGVDWRTGYRVCNSSCPIIFFAGNKRFRGEKLRVAYKVPFGIHQPRNAISNVCTYRTLGTEVLRKYLMFVLATEGDSLFREMMSIPCQTVAPPIEPEKRQLFTGRKTFLGEFVEGFD